MEHVKIPILSHRTFEVTLVKLSRPDLRYKVLVTNDIGRTYFCGAAWRTFTQTFEMQYMTKCKFYLDEGEAFIYFHCENPDPSVRLGFEGQDENYLD